MKRNLFLLSIMILLSVTAAGNAQCVTGTEVRAWIGEFCTELGRFTVLNEPKETEDPAHPGEYLFEYSVGTVTAVDSDMPQPDGVLSVTIRDSAVTDCRGGHVGDSLSAVLKEKVNGSSVQELRVAEISEDGNSWCWVYQDARGIYGVEWIAYLDGGNGMQEEYTLTYVIGADEKVQSIRVSVSTVTGSQATSSKATAREMLSRQEGKASLHIVANDESVMSWQDLTVMDMLVVELPVEKMVSVIGEPVQTQELSSISGRMLLYEGAVFEASLQEKTGEEVVNYVNVTGTGVEGPRGLKVGMTAEEAAALFFCSQDVSSEGGTIYLEGEAEGEPPYAVMEAGQDGTATLCYLCEYSGGIASLEILTDGEEVICWRIRTGKES